MPVVDTMTGILVSLPTYDVNLILAGLEQLIGGHADGLLHAVGDPAAANTGLLSIASLVLLEGVVSNTEPIIDAVKTTLTADMNFIAGLPGLF